MLYNFEKLSHKEKMKQNEEKLKKSIIRSTNSIKRKYRDLHEQRLADEQNFKLQYKPLIEPLNRFIQSKEQLLNFDKINENPEISKEIQTSEDLISDEIPQSDETDSIDDSDQKIDKQITFTSTCKANNSPTSLKTINDCINIVNTKEHDSRFGIRKLRNNYVIGDAIVKLNEHNINVNNQSFTLSDGLKNLLFLKKPEEYTENDANTYKEILLHANVLKSNLNKSGNLKTGSRGYKFMNVIQPLFKSGNGIQTEFMILDKKSDNLEYTYWDDPNELIDRLRLLVSSSAAGHNAHNNEIVAIIEELREANIIF